MTAKTYKPVDVIVGKNVRDIRRTRGVSQERLGIAIGVTFQQVQKYEKGSNRISASTMVAIAGALSCTVADLLNGAENETAATLPVNSISAAGSRLAEAFDKLPERVKGKLYALVMAVASAEQEAADA